MTEILVGILHITGVFVLIIPLWAMGPVGETHETIFNFTAVSGWENLGLACVIGMVPMIGILIGFDCPVHMSEETKDASWTIPNVVMWAVSSNALLVLIVGWSYIFCFGTDVDAVLSSKTGQPVVQVFYNATRSKAGTAVMIGMLCVILISACIGQVATTSRQLWSFARDRGTKNLTFDGGNTVRTLTLISRPPILRLVLTRLAALQYPHQRHHSLHDYYFPSIPYQYRCVCPLFANVINLLTHSMKGHTTP